MENRIIRVEVRNGSVVPAAAEVWLRVETAFRTPTTELRGRLMGPRCRFAATIEVAYPLRPFGKAPDEFEGLSGRVVIPEASLWDPESPFLYQGPLELWQDGRLCERVTVKHGLRARTLGPRGLSINGRRLSLRGRSGSALTETEALTLRSEGVNLLLTPVTTATQPLWELADSIGFLIVGKITHFDAETPALVAALSAHASCLGWLVEPADVGRLAGEIVGVAAEHAPLEGVQFVVGDAGMTGTGLPLLVRGKTALNLPGALASFE